MAPSIFDIITSNENIGADLKSLDALMGKSVVRKTKGSFSSDSINSFVDRYAFLDWEHRGACDSCSRMRSKLGIKFIPDVADDEPLTFRYLEYAYNINKLFLDAVKKVHPAVVDESAVRAVGNSIDHLLQRFCLEAKEVEHRKYILCTKNPAVSEAVNFVDETTALQMVRFTHFENADDLETKRALLKTMAGSFEAIRPKLESGGYKGLAGDLAFLFNNLSIRHNNLEGPKANPAMQSMTDEELLGWYNKAFDLYLEAELAAQHVECSGEIRELKRRVNPKG